jgi:hypothetical protein
MVRPVNRAAHDSAHQPTLRPAHRLKHRAATRPGHLPTQRQPDAAAQDHDNHAGQELGRKHPGDMGVKTGPSRYQIEDCRVTRKQDSAGVIHYCITGPITASCASQPLALSLHSQFAIPLATDPILMRQAVSGRLSAVSGRQAGLLTGGGLKRPLINPKGRVPRASPVGECSGRPQGGERSSCCASATGCGRGYLHQEAK